MSYASVLCLALLRLEAYAGRERTRELWMSSIWADPPETTELPRTKQDWLSVSVDSHSYPNM